MTRGGHSPCYPHFHVQVPKACQASHLHTQTLAAPESVLPAASPRNGAKWMTRPEAFLKLLLLSHPVLSVSTSCRQLQLHIARIGGFPLSPPITLVQPTPFLTWTITMGSQIGPCLPGSRDTAQTRRSDCPHGGQRSRLGEGRSRGWDDFMALAEGWKGGLSNGRYWRLYIWCAAAPDPKSHLRVLEDGDAE